MPTYRMRGSLWAVVIVFETDVSVLECKGSINEPQQFCDKLDLKQKVISKYAVLLLAVFFSVVAQR